MNSDEPHPKVIKKDVKEIHCGGIHTSIIDKDKKLWTFGCGSGIIF